MQASQKNTAVYINNKIWQHYRILFVLAESISITPVIKSLAFILLLLGIKPKCNHLHYLLQLTVAYLRFLACKVIEECRIGEGAEADPLHLHRPRTHRHPAVKVEGLASLQDPQQTAVTHQGVPIHSEGLQTVDRVEGALFQSLQVVGGEVEDADLSEASKGMELHCHQPCAYHDEFLQPQKVLEGPGL